MPQMQSPGVWDTQSNPICSGEPSSFSYGTIRYSYATEIDESEGDFNNAAWVFPMSTVRKEWTTFAPGSDPCDFGESTMTNSFDSTVSAELYPATIGNWNHGYLAGPMYPRCGVLQRRWWSNENCVATGADVGFSPTNLGFFDPNTGEESYQTSLGSTDYCMLREPRRFHGTCSNGATCNAGGECVSGPAPEVRVISTPLP